MNIRLYINYSDRRYVNKNIRQIGSGIAIDYKGECSIATPILILKEFDISCNYIYIEDLKRYYYVQNVTVSGSLYYVECSIDVLMSFASPIKSLTCLVDRQEYNYNEELTDSNIRVNNPVEIGNILIGQCGDSSYHYYLSTVGL